MTETNEQKIWLLQQQAQRLDASVTELLRYVKGGETQQGIRDTLNEIKREVLRVERVASKLESLEDNAVTQVEFKQLLGRIEIIERDRTLQQGARLGRRLLWGITSGAIIFVGAVLTMLLQTISLIRQVVP